MRPILNISDIGDTNIIFMLLSVFYLRESLLVPYPICTLIKDKCSEMDLDIGPT